MNANSYTIVDLFSGAGGISLGLEAPERLNNLANLGYNGLSFGDASFETILAVEQDDNTAATFRHNFSAEVIEDDIRNISSFSSWENADIVVGGPPCQGFSNLNSIPTSELDDERNNLWRHFMRAVEDIQPSVFLLENVPRFLQSAEGARAVKIAEDIGYQTVVETLWGHDFGVPQKRKRSFILGSKLGVPFFPEPPDEPVRTVYDAIGDLPSEPTNENWHVSRKHVTELSKERMRHVPPGGNREDIPFDL